MSHAFRVGQVRRALLSLAAGVLALAALPAQETVDDWKAPPSFVGRTWRVADGLPHNTVMALAQTRDGYLWIGTINGLARFDGVQFRRFGLADGLPSLSVRVLFEDRAGALWIGTDNGLSRYQENKFTSWTVRDGLAGDFVSALVEDREGTIWIATRAGLNRWRRGTLEREATLAGRTIAALTTDAGGGVWVAPIGGGLLRWDGERFKEAETQGAAPVNTSRLLRSRDGRIWAGEIDGLKCLAGNAWATFGREARLPMVGITSLTDGADGTLWVGTRDEGLFFRRDRTFRRVMPEDGLSDTAILATCEDGEKNLWVGTRGDGLCRLRPRQVFVWHHRDSGVEVAARSLAEAPDGSVWVAAYGRGLYRGDPERPGRFLRQSLPSLPDVLWSDALCFGRDGSLWLVAGSVVRRWRNGKLVAEYPLPGELGGDTVRCVREDRDRGVWMGTWAGRVVLLREGRCTVFSEGLPGAMTSAVVQQTDGTLWIGSYGGGVGRLTNGVGTTVRQRHGLSSDLVRALLLDSKDTLWIGTEGGGLNCLRGGEIRAFGAQHGLETDTVVQILEDDAGDLWLGTYQGVLRIARRELDELLAGQRTRLHPRKFDHADGLLSAQCNTGPNGALKTRDGRLFFCTYQGLLHIDPKQVTAAPAPPVVRVEEFMAGGRAWTAPPASTGAPKPLEIPPGQQRFEFHYTALRAAAPEQVRFRYRLIGLESEWTDADTRRIAHYSYLPPGRYRFEVAAHGGDGAWSRAIATLPFAILPRFWETWWFRIVSWLSGVAIAAGIVVLLLRRRHRLQLQSLEQQRAVERERARIARDMHDELGSRLTKAGMVAEMAERDGDAAVGSRQRLQVLRHTLAEMTVTMDELVWAVNPKHDTLDGLANYVLRYAQEFFADTPIRCELNIPADLPAVPLPAAVRHNLFLAFKEALTNAAKHASPTSVAVRVQAADGHLRLEIEDNGSGIDSSAASGAGRGLENMRERLRAIGGRAILDTVPGQGTRVRLELPLPP